MVGSVLVFSLGEILGDGVYKLQLLPALVDAFPGAAITWYAGEQGSVYARSLGYVAEHYLSRVITDPSSGARPLRSLLNPAPFGGEKFDVVIDTQMLLAPALVARRAAREVFVSAVGNFALSTRKPEGPPPAAMVERLARLIALAADRPVQPRMPPEITDDRSRAAAAALLPDGPSYVGLVPGAGAPVRRWPLDRFLAIGQRLTDEGHVPVFFIGPAEMEMEAPIRAALLNALIPELDRTDTFRDIAGPRLGFALAGRLTAAIANDCGMGHVIGGGGAPLLTLFLDPRYAAKFPTPSPRPAALAASAFGTDGMASIPVDAVWNALQPLLAGA